VKPAVTTRGRDACPALTNLKRDRGHRVAVPGERVADRLPSYSTPTGRMLAGIFARWRPTSGKLMHERAAAARQTARLRGRHTGRPPRLTPAQARQVQSLRADGESIGELVRSFGVSRAAIYRPGPDPVAAESGSP
jgi:DNA invertase Pin-like site-specific DNA recombinase